MDDVILGEDFRGAFNEGDVITIAGYPGEFIVTKVGNPEDRTKLELRSKDKRSVFWLPLKVVVDP